MNKNVLRSMSYGVYVVTTAGEGNQNGCTANSAMQITSDPATVAVSINHNNYTNELISKNGVFAVSILGENSDPSIIGNFGFKSGKDSDKFEGISCETVAGVPVISDSVGYVVCKVIGKMETSSHTVFLGEIVEGDVLKKDTPMTYAYYHNVIKGKSPKNAPTYIEENASEEKKPSSAFKCDICGYIYEGEEVPADYRCPVCGMDASHFVKVQ